MEYATLVQSNTAKLGEQAKSAKDLAVMLDNPIFAIGNEGDNVNERERLFNIFCAAASAMQNRSSSARRGALACAAAEN